jgi:outer membrane protein TolC
VALSNELYLRELGNFLNVLDSERWLFASQSDCARSEATVSINVVALYNALRGAGRPCASSMKALGYG